MKVYGKGHMNYRGGGRDIKKHSRSLYEDGSQGVNNDYSTPHQKVLNGSLGLEKAQGMGRIVVKRKKM